MQSLYYTSNFRLLVYNKDTYISKCTYVHLHVGIYKRIATHVLTLHTCAYLTTSLIATSTDTLETTSSINTVSIDITVICVTSTLIYICGMNG